MSHKASPNQSTNKSHDEVIEDEPIIATNKRSLGGIIEDEPTNKKPRVEDEPTKANIDINLHPDGNQVGIDINGTIVNATKRSFDITIGKFSISLGNRSTGGNIASIDLLPSPVLAVAVLSICTGKPLHIVTEDFSTIVTANLSLSKLIVNHTIL